ncbi:PAS domain-containing protein [Ekhidna sp.]|jgi:PAS domain S-box-containing protein|uniref:PAS domain-containing protein n=1 Tax=Ekhidna sp. TaxID=2608089 RepID=UPI0032ED4492
MGLNFSFIKSLHRASPVAVGAMDMVKDEIIYSSGHAEKILGYSKEGLKKHSKNYFESIVHPDDRQKSRDAINQLMESNVGEIVECTLRVRKSNGEYLTLLIRDIVFDRDDENSPMKFTTIVQDVSDVVALENKLNEKLEVIRRISYKNSHELRAPVANIIGLMSLMKEENFKTEYNAKIFHHLEETVAKLDEVIHDINNLSND